MPAPIHDPPEFAPEFRPSNRRAWALCAAVAVFMLGFAAAGLLAPPPWWRREAGPPPRPFLGLSWSNGFLVADAASDTPTGSWLLTTAGAVRSCRRVTVGSAELSAVAPARIIPAADPWIGLAVLHLPVRPPAALRLEPGTAPPASANGTRLTVLGFPAGRPADLPADRPVRVAAIVRTGNPNPRPEDGARRLVLSGRAGPEGSPVLDPHGAVVGMVAADGPRGRDAATLLLPVTALRRALPPPAGIAPRDREPPAPAADAAVVRVFCFHASLFPPTAGPR